MLALAKRLTRATVGLTASVGHAAGLVVTAPLAILNPDTRENYGDQTDALRDKFEPVGTRSRMPQRRSEAGAALFSGASAPVPWLVPSAQKLTASRWRPV